MFWYIELPSIEVSNTTFFCPFLTTVAWMLILFIAFNQADNVKALVKSFVFVLTKITWVDFHYASVSENGVMFRLRNQIKKRETIKCESSISNVEFLWQYLFDTSNRIRWTSKVTILSIENYLALHTKSTVKHIFDCKYNIFDISLYNNTCSNDSPPYYIKQCYITANFDDSTTLACKNTLLLHNAVVDLLSSINSVS